MKFPPITNGRLAGSTFIPDLINKLLAVAIIVQSTFVAAAQFVAFNDHAAGSGTHVNVTRYNIFGSGFPTNGALKDIVSGDALAVTLRISRSSSVTSGTLYGTPASGTPLHSVFNDYVDFGGASAQYPSAEVAGGAAVTYTFSGLNPASYYSFKGSAVRGDPAYTNRWTLCELTSADAFTQAHSSSRVLTSNQVSTLASNQAVLLAGVNHTADTGDYVGWDAIRPGSDGSVSVVCKQYTNTVPGGSSGGSKAYALTGIRLEETPGGPSSPVSILQSPLNVCVMEGEAVILHVSAGGSPRYYQWFKDNEALQDATNASLTINAATTNHSGAYFCTVTNELNSVNSSIASVIVLPDLSVPLLRLNHAWRYNHSGADLGTTWKEIDYPDDTWLEGAGVLAYENNSAINPLTNTILSLTNSSGERIITYYFRTTFVYTNEPGAFYLSFSNLVDDGAVVYLNGEELYRMTMPNTPINAGTFASTWATEGVFQVTNFMPSTILHGTNYLAVEVHQNTNTSTDIVFGMAVRAVPVAAGPALIWKPPQGQSAQLGSTVTLTVGAAGLEPITYQWSRNGVNLVDDGRITGATAATLKVANLQSNDFGGYRVYVNNPFGGEQSSQALVVLPFANLVSIASWPGYPRGNAEGFFLSGDRLYVAQGWGGFAIYDVSGSGYPTFIGAADAGETVNAVFVRDSLAYLADRSLRIMDISNPAQPVLLGDSRVPGSAGHEPYAIAVVSNTAYMATQSGLVVVDVTDPSRPVAMAPIQYGSMTWGPRDVAWANNYLYVVGDNGTLEIFDVSNPTNPVHRASRMGDIGSITIKENYAYLALNTTFSHALEVVDISNPLAPRLVGHSNNDGIGQDIWVEGSTIYVADMNEGVRIYSLLNQTNPVLLAHFTLADNIEKVIQVGHYLYLAGYESCYIWDVSNPGSPLFVSRLGHDGFAKAIQKSGNLLYVAQGDEGLAILDVTVSAQPVPIGSYVGGAGYNDVQVIGSLAYVASKGLRVLDVSNPTNPVVVGKWEDTWQAAALAVRNNFVYLACGNGIKIVYMHSLTNIVWGYTYPGRFSDICFSGNYAYLAAETAGLEVVDVSNMNRPVHVTTYDTPGSARALTLSGNYLYLANDLDGVYIFDVREPANPVLVGSYHTSGNVYGVTVDGTRLWVATYASGVRILDISDPTMPVQIGKIVTGGYASAVCLDGDYVYVANGESGVLVLQRMPLSEQTSFIKLSQPGLRNGAFGFHVSGVNPEQRFIMEASTNLRTWHGILTNLGPPPVFQYTPPGTNSPARFYRAKQF